MRQSVLPNPCTLHLPLALLVRFPSCLPTVPGARAVQAPSRPVSWLLVTSVVAQTWRVQRVVSPWCTHQDICYYYTYAYISIYAIAINHVQSSRSRTSLEDLIPLVRSMHSSCPVLTPWLKQVHVWEQWMVSGEAHIWHDVSGCHIWQSFQHRYRHWKAPSRSVGQLMNRKVTAASDPLWHSKHSVVFQIESI